MKTPQGPSLFSKQTSINTYIVQTSPGTPTPVCWTQWLDCGLSRKTHHCCFVQKRSSLVGNTLQVYSTQYHVAYVVGNTLQVYSTQYSTVQYTVQYMWLEIHYKCTVQYQVVLVQKRSSRTLKNFYKYKFHTHRASTKDPPTYKMLSKPLTTCLADKTNHPVERLSLNRSQCGSCSTKYDTLAGT